MNQIFNQAMTATGGKLELSALRPYINKKGVPVTSIRTGDWKDVVLKNGQIHRQPIMRQVPVQNALLRKYEWEQIDRAVLDVVRAPNVALNDFLRLGLTQPLDGLGVIVSTYEQLGDMTEANVSMEGIVRGEQDRTPFTPQTIPVPLIHKDFQLSLRHLEASRRGGNESLDTTQARVATRKVQDKVDDIIFSGHATQLSDGNPIYGLTNKPQRLQKTSANCGGGDFGTAGNFYKTLNGAIAFLRELGYYGPYGVYVATNQYAQTNALVSGTAVSERTAGMDQLPEVSFINQAHKLTDGEMVVFQATQDVADIAIAQDTTPVQWEGLGGFMIDFRIFTALTIRVKHDSNDSCGVCHVTGC
jgi:uncharacterized linocin/CFP29 family protein